MNIMLDLETHGTAADSVIIAIGACKFSRKEGKVYKDTFYMNIDPESCKSYGLKSDPSTLAWWAKQSQEAKDALKVDQQELAYALVAFTEWMGAGKDKIKVWGNGSDFDNTILANAFNAVGLKTPWKFWNNRCFRTMKAEHYKVKMERVGTHHNAVDDALTQAHHLIKISG